MLRKLLLVSLIVAAGSALAASAAPLSLWRFISVAPFAGIGVGHALAEPDSLAMYLAGIAVMGLIAHRRFR